MKSNALVLFSGGQDSATCLAWALKNYSHVETIGFDYGQRHHVELQCRQQVLLSFKEKIKNTGTLGQDHLLNIPVLGEISNTALTSDQLITLQVNGLPSTFVPARNLLFLTLAAALAYRRGIFTLVGGMCETDYSGYPDCRQNTITAQETTLQLGIDPEFSIQTPLMHLNKAQTWALAAELGGQELINIILEDTHTCYLGDRSQRHAWGYGCGTCPACELRSAGWKEWAQRAADQHGSPKT
jgi:7-cyano-7-deazaguanine synthase